MCVMVHGRWRLRAAGPPSTWVAGGALAGCHASDEPSERASEQGLTSERKFEAAGLMRWVETRELQGLGHLLLIKLAADVRCTAPSAGRRWTSVMRNDDVTACLSARTI